MEYDQFNRVFYTRYHYRSPLGVLTLVDENGEPVEDRQEAPTGTGGVDEARAFMRAEASVSTLRAMDRWL